METELLWFKQDHGRSWRSLRLQGFALFKVVYLDVGNPTDSVRDQSQRIASSEVGPLIPAPSTAPRRS